MMSTLLSIQASPRGTGSLSRNLSDVFVTEWQKNHEGGKVVVRDLAHNQLPLVELPWIASSFLPREQWTPEMHQAMAIPEELVAELFAADHILIGTPMYNYTVPASLKAWIDLVVRPNVTFSAPPERKGLVTGKRCTIIMASGGIYDQGGPAKAFDYESGYLKSILGLIGLSEIEFIMAGGTIAYTLGATTMEEMVQKYQTAVLAAAK